MNEQQIPVTETPQPIIRWSSDIPDLIKNNESNSKIVIGLDRDGVIIKENGYITFCSFSNPAKINDATLSVWSKIISAIPNSILLIKYGGIDSNANRKRLLLFHEIQSS